MPSISSLLKSAAATRKKIRNQQDAFAAFEWESSAQTYDEFLTYSEYLQEQSGKTTDPSELLTYQTKMRSVRRSFTSNELQRAQMAILEGRATTQDKMGALQELYYQAVDNQDFNLAQNLLSQWDSLSIKLQNEQEAASRAFSASSKKAKDTLVNDLTKGVDDVTLPNGVKVTPLSQIARDLEETGGGSVTWKAASDTLEALRGVIIDQYQNATSQEEVDKLEEKYGAGLQDLDKEVFFQVGGKKLNLQQVVNAAANEDMNNPLYSLKAVRNEATGRNEFKLTENAVDRLDYVRQIDEQGEEFYVPATIRTDQEKLMFGQSDQGRGLKTQITDAGEVIGGGDRTGKINLGAGEVERNASQTIENRLKALGIIAKQNGTTLTIKLPGESVQREATIQPDGSLRFYNDSGELVEMGLVNRNLYADFVPANQRTGERAGELRTVSPEELSDFGQSSAFGGTLSRASAQGERYVKDIMGRVTPSTVDNLSGPIRIGNDFSGFGTAVTSNILQSAGATRQKIAQEKARQDMLQAQAQAATSLQASQTFNLNQTPIQQYTSQGIAKRQLQVAAPTPQPRLYIAPPQPSKKITVGVARPTGNISVGVARPRTGLTVGR